MLTLELPELFVAVNLSPATQKVGSERWEYRLNSWEPSIRQYVNSLQAVKPVLLQVPTNPPPERAHIFVYPPRSFG